MARWTIDAVLVTNSWGAANAKYHPDRVTAVEALLKMHNIKGKVLRSLHLGGLVEKANGIWSLVVLDSKAAKASGNTLDIIHACTDSNPRVFFRISFLKSGTS